MKVKTSLLSEKNIKKLQIALMVTIQRVGIYPMMLRLLGEKFQKSWFFCLTENFFLLELIFEWSFN